VVDLNKEIDGYDPLAEPGSSEAAELLEAANKRIIENILKCYTGYFDLFSELVQNALDAVEKKSIDNEKYKPCIWIDIDLDNKKVRVTDNGVGMRLQEFKYFLKPNVSFKDVKENRGHKGVGATFLAYGFSAIKVQTRGPDGEISAVVRQGRQWAEDHSGTIPRPKFETQNFSISELSKKDSGTSVEVILGSSPGERPRDLTWLNAQNAHQWSEVLRIKTPLGGVYLDTPPFITKAVVRVIDTDGTKTENTIDRPEYYYPHEIPNIKVQDLNSLSDTLNKIDGSPDEKFGKLKNDFKRLDCIYEIWNKNDILDENSPFKSIITPEIELIINRHKVSLYASFYRSAKIWTEINDDILKLRKGQRIVHGGLQMASDYMVQGDLSVIPLTSAIGYQANSHVIVHFMDGAPDLGRKTFQPELKELAELLSVRAVNTLKKYLQHMKPDTGSQIITPDKEIHEWKKNQELYRDSHPLGFVSEQNKHISIISIPQQEQDVIALFHQLRGMDTIRGINFFATSQSDKYDSLFMLEYLDDSYYYDKDKNSMGVNHDLSLPYSSEPKVLEYKWDIDDLIYDFDKEIKFAKHIDLVICWTATKHFKEKYYLSSLLVKDEGSIRQIFGSTHQAFPEGGGGQPQFEVIILDDLLRFIQDPVAEEARQLQIYES